MMSLGDAGLYSLGYRLGSLGGTFVVAPFNQTWLPRRYEIHEQPDHERVFGRVFFFASGVYNGKRRTYRCTHYWEP